jgi:hypothetical protein
MLIQARPLKFRAWTAVALATLLLGPAHATLLWDGNATNGTSVFKLLNLEDENGVSQGNPSTNGSSVTAVSDPIYGTVWRFYKAVNDLRCEAHGANGINPAIGQTYYIGWRTKLALPTPANLNAIFQWKAYGTPQLQDFPITIAPGSGNLNLNQFNPSGAGGQTFLWSTPLVTNVWNQHVLVISVSDQDYGGYLEYWWNGVQQTFNTGTNRFYCRTFDGTSVDPKWGAYGGDIYAVYDYVTGLKIGTTYADVVDTLYALSASPPSQYTGLNGTNISYTINVVTNIGFSGSIQLTVSGLPANTSYSLSQASFSGAGTATLTVTTSNSTPQGTYTVLLRGINGSQTNYYTVEMKVSKPPGTYVWNGPGAGANNWSASGNWSPSGPPGAIDNVEFFDTGAVSSVSNVNNFVDSSFGGSIATLVYGNTNNNHTTSIAAGQTLNVGSLTVGTETDNGSAQAVFATITGPGATLAVNSTSDLVVRQGSASSGSQRATLEMSGLGICNATVGRVLVGVLGTIARATGTLYLGKTNTIIASGAYPQICVGDNHGNGGGQNYLYLGQSNSIFANSMTIGRQKATGTLAFNSRFSNPIAYFRNIDGVSPVNSWSIGDNSAQSTSSSSSTGTCDFSLGIADALVNAISVGLGQTTTGANSSGTLTFASGTINANTLQIGVQSANGATSAGIGKVNVNGTNAVLVVNSALTLGSTIGGAGTTNTYGTLNVNRGTVLANAILAGAGSGPNSIAITNGVLVLTNAMGTSAAPINSLGLTNAWLHLNLNGASNVTNIVATTVVPSGTTKITVDSVINVTNSQVFHLLSYSGTDPYAGLALGSLPPGFTSGGLLDNAAGQTIDLMISSGPFTNATILGVTLAGTNLVIHGTNNNGGQNFHYAVMTATNLTVPRTNWTVLSTNSFNPDGSFFYTNPVSPSVRQQFFDAKAVP